MWEYKQAFYDSLNSYLCSNIICSYQPCSSEVHMAKYSYRSFKVLMHRNLRTFFYWLKWATVDNREESFLPFVDICFSSRDMSFQSLRNLEKKICDVTSRTLLLQYLIQMPFRRYWSESSKTWYTYETKWEELQNIKYFVAMATFWVRTFINQKHNYLIF